MLVHDLQTKEKFLFICEDWLSLGKGDGKIARLLPVADEKQKKQFRWSLEKKTKQEFSNGHLWFSVLIRPIQSSFNRLERLTCCLVLLCSTMLVNIIYYGADEAIDPSSSVQLGFIVLSREQVVKTNLQ